MSELYVNAPIQNKEFDPDSQEGRILPIYTATALNQHDVQPVHLWNNVLASEQGDHTRDSYLNQSEVRLDAKYQSVLLGRLAHDSSKLTDTDSDFVDWAKELTATVVQNGTLVKAIEKAHVCKGCGATIALAGSPVEHSCRICGGEGSELQLQNVLISYFNQSAKRSMQSSPNISNSDAMRLSERRYIVSKPRVAGIDLEDIGLPGQVIDPKVAIGLLAIYAAEIGGHDSVNVVAGRSSAFNNVSNLFSFLGDSAAEHPTFDVVPIARAPIEYLHHLKSEAIITDEKYYQILDKILPASLPHMSSDMTPETLERLVFSHQYKHV